MHDSAFPADLSRMKRSIPLQSLNFYECEKCFLACGFMNYVARGSKVRLLPVIVRQIGQSYSLLVTLDGLWYSEQVGLMTGRSFPGVILFSQPA